MNIIVSDNIYLENREIPNDVLKFIKSMLVFPNPGYNPYEPEQGVSKIINLILNRGRYVIIPRGFLYLLVRYLRDNGIKFKLTNKTKSKTYNNEFDSIPLYDYQKDAVENALRIKQGVIVMPCGSGKTRTLIEVIRKSKMKSLIIVNSDFLVNQWKEYIKEFFGYTCGIIQANNYKIKNITIATIQTLNNLVTKLDEKFFNRWGLICIDEVHHQAARTYQRVIPLFTAQFRLGTTATMSRNDGLSRLINYSIGQNLYRITAKELEDKGMIITPDIVIVPTQFKYYSRNWHRVTKSLVNNEQRNKKIIELLEQTKDRNNLVLSSRIEHLNILAKMYSDLGYNNFEVVTSKVGKKERVNIINRMIKGKLKVIFATQLADEGLDIPNLDTLHLVFPTKSRGKLEQRIGRTQRIYKDKLKPIVYDYVDGNVPILNNMFNHRRGLYNKLGLKTNRYIMNREFVEENKVSLFDQLYAIDRI